MNPKNPSYSFRKAWSFNPGTPISDGISPDWLAAFWEGEGHFSVTRAFHKKRNCWYWNVVVAISQSKERGRVIIQDIQKALGYGRVQHRPEGYRGRAQDWKYAITNRDEAKRFFETVYPYLRFRREEVDEKLALLRDVETAGPHFDPSPSALPFKRSWSWPHDIEQKIKTLIEGYSLHVCSGESDLGDVRIDLEKACDVKASMFNLPVRRAGFDTVICDPPWELRYNFRHKLLYELRDALKPGGLLIFNSFWFPRVRGLDVDKEVYVGVPHSTWRNASLLITARRMALTTTEPQAEL